MEHLLNAPSYVDRAFGSSDHVPPVSGERRRSPAPPVDLLHSVVARAPFVLWAVDPDGVFTLTEGGALAKLGPAAQQMAVGRSALDAYRGVRVIERGGRITTGESLLLRALASEPCAGLAEIGEERYDTRMVPVLGLAGEVTGVIGVAIEVTDRIQAEARLLQKDRLVTVGTLAAGVTHEIDSPLSSVMKSLDFVAHILRACTERCRSVELVSGPSIAETLEASSSTLRFAREGSARMRRIVRDLNTFAQGSGEQRSLLDLRAVFAPVINLVSSQIQRHARLVRDFRDVPLVDVNEARLGHVLMNLLVNAAQAIPEGNAENNEIGVTTCTDEAGDAVLEVRDTGPGIPADLVCRIFEPFVTTLPRGLSPGLGLPICYGIVTAFGGEISVRSTRGEGSVFRVTIPAAAVGALPSPSPMPELEQDGSSSSVWCVRRAIDRSG
jgi:two-component system, NtrC family, sensor kinase